MMFSTLPSLNSLKVFEVAARLMSFKKAADELNVSPTAVSHQVRNLEETLNIKLFVRHTRSLSLTYEGERLAASAHKTLRELLQSVNAIRAIPDTLYIGTTNSFAAMWLVPHLEDFKNKNTGIDVQIDADDKLIDIENDRRIDMVIRYGLFNGQAGAELLTNESLGCFATPDYWLKFADRDFSTFLCVKWKNKSLPQQNFKQLLSSFVPCHKELEIRYFNDENQMVQAALTGQGVAIISKELVATPLANGWLVQNLWDVSNAIIGLDYYCMIPKRNRQNPNVLRFANWLRTQMSCDEVVR